MVANCGFCFAMAQASSGRHLMAHAWCALGVGPLHRWAKLGLGESLERCANSVAYVRLALRAHVSRGGFRRGNEARTICWTHKVEDVRGFELAVRAVAIRGRFVSKDDAHARILGIHLSVGAVWNQNWNALAKHLVDAMRDERRSVVEEVDENDFRLPDRCSQSRAPEAAVALHADTWRPFELVAHLLPVRVSHCSEEKRIDWSALDERGCFLLRQLGLCGGSASAGAPVGFPAERVSCGERDNGARPPQRSAPVCAVQR